MNNELLEKMKLLNNEIKKQISDLQIETSIVELEKNGNYQALYCKFWEDLEPYIELSSLWQKNRACIVPVVIKQVCGFQFRFINSKVYIESNADSWSIRKDILVSENRHMCEILEKWQFIKPVFEENFCIKYNKEAEKQLRIARVNKENAQAKNEKVKQLVNS